MNKVQFEFGLTCAKILDKMTNSTDTLIVQLNINVPGAMFLDIVIKQDNEKEIKRTKRSKILKKIIQPLLSMGKRFKCTSGL